MRKRDCATGETGSRPYAWNVFMWVCATGETGSRPYAWNVSYRTTCIIVVCIPVAVATCTVYVPTGSCDTSIVRDDATITVRPCMSITVARVISASPASVIVVDAGFGAITSDDVVFDSSSTLVVVDMSTTDAAIGMPVGV